MTMEALTGPTIARDAPIDVGIIVNLNAREHRGRGEAPVREVRAWAGDAKVVATKTRAEADHALASFVREGVNVVAVAGGDGTLHHAVQSLRRGPERFHGALAQLPSGTLNIVARATSGDVRAWLRALAGRPFGAMNRRALDVLEVTSPSVGTKWGFVFGSEMVKNALELYDHFGGGYTGLSRFLLEAGRGYLFRTELWERESWRLTPPRDAVTVDGSTMPTYSAVVAATCELAVAGGVVRALSRPGGNGFSARVVTETRTGPLLALIPTLMREGNSPGVRAFAGARQLTLRGAFTLDGETYGTSSRDGAAGEELRVRLGEPVSLVGQPASESA